MKSLGNIQKIITQFNVKPRPQMRSKVLDQALEIQRNRNQPNIYDIPVWRIIMKNRITKFTSLAAIMAIAVFVGTSFLNGKSAWAKVLKAFNQVENVHIIQKMIMTDGSVKQAEFYLKRPNLLYQKGNNQIVIDNGQERLTIDNQDKTAQFADSFMPYKPLEEHYMFETINIFQAEGYEGVEITELDDESDESTLVFSLNSTSEISNVSFKGKAWVDAVTMLPIKTQLELTSKPKQDEPVSGEILFSYEPIADEIFAMVIPEGFTELPRKRHGAMSGKVLDEHEQPVANAIVYVIDRTGKFAERTTTDQGGQFIFELPPEGVGKPVWLPVLLRAFSKDFPDRIAWSIIKAPRVSCEPGGHIPGDVAHIDNDDSILKTANGITLQMEPAGTIAGQVTDTDGAPISDAKVKLLRCDLADKHGNVGLFGIDVHKWSGPYGLGIVQTDITGWYRLNNLPQLWKRTKVYIRAQAEGFVGKTKSFYAKGPIEYEELDFKLYEAGLTVTGTLIDNYGKPIVKAPIYAVVDGKVFRACSTKTDKRGLFTLHDCPDTPDLQIKAELSHGISKNTDQERIYFPDALATIDYHRSKTTYEVEITAYRPEIIFNVVVRNTSGEIIKYFPVEIRADAGTISTLWEVDKKFIRRTNEKGKCTFTEVPDVNGLRLILYGGNNVRNENPEKDARKYIEENKKKYFWSEMPINVVEGKNKYNIIAVALTEQEWRAQKEQD